VNDPATYRLGYYAAVSSEEDAASDALGHIRAREDAREITTAEAAAERIQLLQEHLDRLARLRVTYLGGAS
jgi:hypothetical protein